VENRKISVVVVDDSAFMRMVLKDIIDSQQDMEVVGFARDGIEALEIIPKKKPDVVTLDVEMPKLNGIEVLKQLMKSFPTRVIMVSSLTEEGADITLRALTLGAVDFITKPAGSTSMSFRQVADLLIEKIREAAIVDLSKLRKSPQMLPSLVLKRRHLVSTSKVVVIGSSTGGPKALEQVIPRLPKDFPAPVMVIQHMPPVFTKSLAARLDSMSQLTVKEAVDGERVEKGFVYIAPGDFHMGVKSRNSTIEVFLEKSDKINNVRPSVDFTLDKVTELYKKDTVAIILTGMGRDGAKGCFKVKYYSGKVIAESKETCVVYGMPKAVVDEGYADFVLPVHRIAEKLIEIV